jgi:phosphatidylserine/phosphatidylglycerophosphate/cardiolipin synthase-like enzyme
MMKKILLITLATLYILFAQYPHRDFEIVESIPVETTLDNPEIRNTQEVWLEMINSAKKTIDVEQFYIANETDEALEIVLQALEKRAMAGVKIRLIVENSMADTYPEPIERLSDSDNIDVRILKAFKTIHGINHSKYFIVDKEKVFLGSQNFDWRALSHIHEIGLNIHHKEFAETITKIFELNWQQAATGKLIETEDYGKITKYELQTEGEKIVFFPTASPYKNMPEQFYSDELAIIETIKKAEKSISIQLLSYSPSAYGEYYGTLDNALRDAALRGVKVHLLVSDWCSRKYEIPYLKSLQVLPNIEVKHSTIPEYSKKYIPFGRVEHCKMMTVDNQLTWIGTSNWKKNYFHSSRNLGVIIDNKRINETIQGIFNKSWNSDYSKTVDINKNYKPKRYGEKE